MTPVDLVQQSFLAGPIDIQLLRDERLHDLFEASAQRTPLATAMTCAGQSISYGELQALTDRWSRSLRARGIQPGSKVGIWLSRSIALHAAVLAVLKAGATYLPFDDQAPAERVSTCLEDCGADGGRRAAASPVRQPGRLHHLHLRIDRSAQGRRGQSRQHLPSGPGRKLPTRRGGDRHRLCRLLGRVRHVARGGLYRLPRRRLPRRRDGRAGPADRPLARHADASRRHRAALRADAAGLGRS
ncbi:MAG: hypothetical protein EON55_24900 [Alphaproteobacteria bacterium]|nr:MAG: hypothetical protein EON55_24900 [Alphaproteobacteria bacterium]